MKKQDTYYNAKLAILSELFSCPVIRNTDWRENRRPSIGSLVSLTSAGTSKWYLSWVVDIEPPNKGYERVLLKSIEDGELCWWGNVAIFEYNPDVIKASPYWKWSDKQFVFQKRWSKVLKQNGSYIIRSGGITFNDDGSVELALRKHAVCMTDSRYTKKFPDWKKTTMKMMDEFYKSAETIDWSKL